MISISSLTVAFGDIRPLDDLSAELAAPIVGLIGPNGAGKTTLLNVISGFVHPASGSITVAGHRLDRSSPQKRAKLGIRRTFQQEQVVEDLTVWENVQAVADHLAASTADIRRALDLVGLSSVDDTLGAHLNLFQRRKVEIAKTLVGRPVLILLDEPAAGLDDVETRELMRLLTSIPEVSGAQLVLIDHDAALIASVCAEVLALDFGKRLALGPTRLVLDDPAVRDAYLGEV
jgi:ABC-type branched-subunit amino acid transport system ATPase component